MTDTADSIYQRLLAAGCEMDNHESDLYVKVTKESSAVIQAWMKEGSGTVASPTIFTSNIDGQAWYDIPFCYQPFWEARRAR